MIKVTLLSKPSVKPIHLISHAAKTCYTSKVPKLGATLDINNSLFKTGHHTTFQHSYYTFNISGLSVSSTIFGLHLSHPFYNSDQRSGRYSNMFKSNSSREKYIKNFWPETNIKRVLTFIENGRKIYLDNFDKAVELTSRFLQEERPNANSEYIKQNSQKIAQEQMRTFLSTIAPTSLDFTVNLSAIAALYRSAFTPELRFIFNKIKNTILKEEPELSFMFSEKAKRKTNWYPKFEFDNIRVLDKPIISNVEVISLFKRSFEPKHNPDSVDLRYFTPELMDNNMSMIKNDLEISLATFGQEQRHRTMKRSEPIFSGGFYLPPVPRHLGLQNVAKEYFEEYKDIVNSCKDKTLSVAIAPYGATVKYTRIGELNGILHEQEKRLCWCAQEEIYSFSQQLYQALFPMIDQTIIDCMLPSCYHGKCIEGKRYCGRELKHVRKERTVPNRNV